MLYVEGRKSFEVRSEKKIMTLPCAKNNTRQTIEFAVCKKNAHSKVFAVCQHMAKYGFCRVLFFAVRFRRGTRQSISLPCARQKAHGKDLSTRQTSVFP